MRKIEMLVDEMRKELDGALEYARKVIEYSKTDKELSDTYRQLARQEVNNSDMLHDAAVRIIRDYGSDKEIPPAMQAIWDYEHKKLIEQKADIMMMLNK